MDIWVFGNPDLAEDALPVKLLPQLQAAFPQHRFLVRDPLEEWDMPDRLLVIDTVKGPPKVELFHDVADFANTPRLTMHDYDLGTTLKWLKKLHKLPPLTLIGVPDRGDPKELFDQLKATIARL